VVLDRVALYLFILLFLCFLYISFVRKRREEQTAIYITLQSVKNSAATYGRVYGPVVSVIYTYCFSIIQLFSKNWHMYIYV